MCKINIYNKLSFFLLIIGALNWGTIGLLNFNIVSILVGGSTILLRLLYIIIFLAAIDIIYLLFKCELVKFSK